MRPPPTTSQALLTPRRIRLILAGTTLVLTLLVLPDWFKVFVPEHQLRKFLLSALSVAEPAYTTALALVAAGLATSITLVTRARRRRKPRPLAARSLLLFCSCLLAFMMAEAVTGAWRAWVHRIPPLPAFSSQFETHDPSTLEVAVIGGSSAYGLPFEKWLSTGHIVAWKLQEIFPGRKVRLDILAEPGVHLERMHQKLAAHPRKPDLLLVYSGHNEFTYRFRWSRSVPHYIDDAPPFDPRRALRDWIGRISPICATIRDAVEANGLGEPPPPEVTRTLVDVPAFTPQEYQDRLNDFRRRLDAIVTHCERIGTIPVLLIPPGNDADFEPNRSLLPPGTPRADREAFARAFQQIRQSEHDDPPAAIVAYRALLSTYPDFAETHYRLGSLLRNAGDLDQAAHHFRAARNLDGLPMRCPSDFQQVHREVAARHSSAILIDGEAAIAESSPSGLLDDSFFLDAMHPNLQGHARLAQAILDGLKTRHALGWPQDTPTPSVDPAQSAAHFGLGPQAWITACEWGASFYRLTAYIRFDPTHRLLQLERYRQAAKTIAAGSDPKDSGLPGIGVE